MPPIGSATWHSAIRQVYLSDYNTRVTSLDEPASANPRFDPLVVGSFFSAVSALGYTAANVCLRSVAETCDPAWVSCIKAVPTAIIAWAIIARRASRGLPALPTGRLLPALVATGLFMQLGGNVSFQWSLGLLGLAMTVPLMFGTLILASALAGRVWLREPITWPSALAMFTLIGAVAVLSWGAERGALQRPPSSWLGDAGPWIVAVAVVAACLAGFAYAACNVVIRRVAGNVLPLSATLMVMSTSGVVGLGLLSLWQIGPAGIASTTPGQWASMFAAGVFNAAAFFSLGLALQATTVTRTNLINASQVALSAVAGIVLFGEQLSVAVAAGIALTVAGLMMMHRK